MQHNKLALLLATAAVLALAACANRAPVAANARPAARPLDANQALLTANWTNPTVVAVNLTEYAIAPEDLAFMVGEPVQLQIRNTGSRDNVFSAPAFFRAVAVRTVAESAVEVPFKPKGFNAARMEQIAFEGVPQLLRLTPHEAELARTSRNPFDRPAAAPTPIDFGDLLGDLGANPFGLDADPAAAPANPFDVLGALGGAPLNTNPVPPPPVAAQPVPPVVTATPAEAAAAAGVALQPGLADDRESALLSEWGAGKLVGLEGFTLKPGEAVYVTFVPLLAGTYAVSSLPLRTAFGMRGKVHIVLPDQATLAAEVAAPAGNAQMLRDEARATR